jgi:hypothetical protein
MGSRSTGVKNEHGYSTYEPAEACSIEMVPVTDGSLENKAFFQATPSGMLQFHTVNAQAAASLELNRDYYLDITPA